jgi:hypothetical protein
MKKLIILLLLNSAAFAQNFSYTNYSAFLNKYVTENGNVNYDKMSKSKNELETILEQFVKNQPTTKWSKDEKMAYYINLYNAYTLKVIIDNYPTKSIKNISNAWSKKFIPVNGKNISLEYIEHEILRKMGDPRIHFGINCASFSCPKLENTAFLPEKLDAQLDQATKSFINDASKNAISENEAKISEIFNWFAGDFKTKGSVIDYINQYSKTKIDKKAKVKYMTYNWNLNK